MIQRQVFGLFRELGADLKCRFYLLSPATSYAGDYIWTGDDRSGCERMLRDTGIAKEEWQMGVTKAFIKNPETVRICVLCWDVS